jgi:hypothetical protein
LMRIKAADTQREQAALLESPSTLQLSPRQPIPPSAPMSPPDRPRIVIGRLSVEVVQSEPAAKQSVQAPGPSQQGRTSSVHGIGRRTNLHFGLGQV